MSSTLRLDRNEGPPPSAALLAALGGIDPEAMRRYRDVSTLEAALAELCRVRPDRVIVTAGADEAIDRACRAYLGPGRTMLLAEPTFEMFDHFAALAGGTLTRVPWPLGPFPIDEFLARLDTRPAVITVVSPNNPTGGVACADDVRRLAAAAPEALVLLDHAYVEYADADLTSAVADLPNVLVVRTLSKAWGLAGCRVGYAIGSPSVIVALRAAGGPYTVAGPSVALALAQLNLGKTAVREHVARVREERRSLDPRLTALGVTPWPSQANFVYVECGPRAAFLAAALRALGVLVRDFPGRAGCETALRITLPGDEAEFAQLAQALETALAPQALLLDLDGVLADVRDSQRVAIAATAASLGVNVSATEVAAAVRGGDAANDWTVTRRLIEGRGAQASLEDVTARYQDLYLGRPGTPGLREHERLIPTRALLERLAARLPLAIVTGRPRDEARWFLERAGVADLFRAVVTMEDAPPKPDPAPVRLALERLGAHRAWLVGDTPDDARAASAASVLPLGVVAPGDDRAATSAALERAGVARVLDDLTALLEVLP
ncbi:MAG TPA: aminotransferase class I/II-fold pyridoxal phosphate-dependent enzyme [Gemmatimonadales bacterium]|nr:aminotransferase class I/II-fold pyridoxal phosphate-dependent enzyme [Gemmatimonadales bacterium]